MLEALAEEVEVLEQRCYVMLQRENAVACPRECRVPACVSQERPVALELYEEGIAPFENILNRYSNYRVVTSVEHSS